MNTRLQQFLAAENITQSQFAESISVAPASISHILSGRNKPGFDFINNMARRYPSLNLEWLITGKGKMYKESSPKSASTANLEVGLFDAQQTESSVNQEPEPENKQTFEPPRPVQLPFPPQAFLASPQNQRKATKIVIFYDDNSFQEFIS